MSRKKGLSVEEKRTRMMEFFYEKKDFFQLKELEKLCQKEKGITSMSVKDILTSLVDDGMVDTDKIGTCVYFWALPSKASQTRKRKIDQLEEQLAKAKEKKKRLEGMAADAGQDREDTDERRQLLLQLSDKTEELNQLSAQIKEYLKYDPKVMEKMQQETVVAKEAANRWTDNIFSIKSWINKKFTFEQGVIDKQFGIPDDFDYVD